MILNQAQKLKVEILALQNRLEQIQETCQHLNLNDADITDDIFSDPFSNADVGFSGITEYTCPDCQAIIVK